MNNLVIGIAARNEANTISTTLDSLTKELLYFPKAIDPIVVIVTNGCTDDTADVVRNYKNDHVLSYKLIVKEISGNLIDAQQLIWKFKSPNSLVIYIDADILFSNKSLLKLYKKSISTKSIAVWSTVIPKHTPKTKLFSVTRILNFRDYYPMVFEPRKYLCGRAYCIKEYPLSICNAGQYKTPGNNIETLLNLKKGPIVDDIYLTRLIRLDYGISSIENCSDSIVYFNPVTSLKDFYISQRRTVFELYRLDLICPEKISVKNNKAYLKKSINISNYNQLSVINKIECKLYLLLYKLARDFAFFEIRTRIYLSRYGLFVSPINVWPVAKSTKTPFI